MTILALALALLLIYGFTMGIDLVPTVGEVLPTSGQPTMQRNAGETVTAGQVVYLKAADDKFWLADANAEASADAKGIALHAALAGQPLKIQTDGPFTIGATAAMTVGEAYFLSETAGGICPRADVTSAWVCYLGTATTAGVLKLAIDRAGATLA